jgi:hypothetical protein
MRDGRRTLDILRQQLDYLENNGYQNALGWRAQLIFQDSPTCPNFEKFGLVYPCTECALIEFVPQESRGQAGACRFIPLDETGQTLDSLYRWASEGEIETVVMAWLRKTIARLEQEPAPPAAASRHGAGTVDAAPGKHP